MKKKIIIVGLTLGLVGTGAYLKSMQTTPQQPSTSQQPQQKYQPKSLLDIATEEVAEKKFTALEKLVKTTPPEMANKITEQIDNLFIVNAMREGELTKTPIPEHIVNAIINLYIEKHSIAYNAFIDKLAESKLSLKQIGTHTGIVKLIAIPSTHQFVSLSQDGSAQLWDTKTQKIIYSINKPRGVDTEYIRSIVSPDGKYLAISYTDYVYVWNLKKQKLLYNHYSKPLPHIRSKAHISSLAINQRNNELIYGTDHSTVNFLNLKTGQLVNSAEIDSSMTSPFRVVNTLATTHNIVAAGIGSTNNLYILKADDVDITGQYTIVYPTVQIIKLLFTPKADRLIIGTRALSLIVWDTATHTPIKTFSNYKINPSLKLNTMIKEGNYATPIAMTKNGEKIAYISTFFVKINKSSKTFSPIEVINTKDGSTQSSLIGHTQKIEDIVIGQSHKTKSWLVSTSQDSTMRIWDINNGQELLKLNTPAVALTIIMDGKTVIYGTQDGNLYSLNLETFDLTSTFNEFIKYQITGKLPQ